MMKKYGHLRVIEGICCNVGIGPVLGIKGKDLVKLMFGHLV